MLVIRKDQMAEFSKPALENFVQETVRLLEARPLKGSGTPPKAAQAELRALVEAGIEKARSHGITREADVVFFCELLLDYGQDLESRGEFSWLRTVLEHPSFPGWAKVQQIRTRLDADPSRATE